MINSFQGWTERLADLIGLKTLAGAGLTTNLLPTMAKGPSQKIKGINRDPILRHALDIERDMRLEREFARIREEERNVLDRLILVD